METIFVVTIPENGWDCIAGVFKAPDKNTLRNYLMIEWGPMEEKQFNNTYVIFEQIIREIK